MPLGDIALFAMLFGGTVYYRRTPARHKSLMFLTAVNFLPPAIGRLPIGANRLVFVGITIGLALLCHGLDTWRRRRADRVILCRHSPPRGFVPVAHLSHRHAGLGTDRGVDRHARALS